MQAYKPAKGIARKPMRIQLRNVPRKVKPIKVSRKRQIYA